jgi:hypothetical protein
MAEDEKRGIYPLFVVKLNIEAKKRIDVLNWLSSMDSKSKHNEIKSKRVKGSGKWLLESEKFVNWLKESSSMLYCKGPGTSPYSDFANNLLA